jgi:hypothetical protein
LLSHHCTSHPPSANQGNTVPPLPSPHCLLRGEDSGGEFSSLFNFFSFQTFLTAFFSVKLLFSWLCHHPPSVYQGNKCTPPPSPCRLLRGEAHYGEFPACFLFPPLF